MDGRALEGVLPAERFWNGFASRRLSALKRVDHALGCGRATPRRRLATGRRRFAPFEGQWLVNGDEPGGGPGSSRSAAKGGVCRWRVARRPRMSSRPARTSRARRSRDREEEEPAPGARRRHICGCYALRLLTWCSAAVAVAVSSARPCRRRQALIRSRHRRRRRSCV
jgi:hypothetical protein